MLSLVVTESEEPFRELNKRKKVTKRVLPEIFILIQLSTRSFGDYRRVTLFLF